MQIIEYKEEHILFKKRLKEFLKKEVVPHVDRWEKEGIVPKDIWRRMGREGFLCPCVSKEYGGIGGDFRYSVIVAEELAGTWHGGLAANLHSDIVVPYIESYGTRAQKEKYLPGCVSGDIITAVAMTEPGAGSDLAGISTLAVEGNGEVMLSGSKTFISNGINADLVIVAARNPDIGKQHQDISLYIVESGTPGFKRGRKLEKMGFKSQDTAELFFNDCRIPAGNRLGDKGGGFFMLMEKLQQERLTCAVCALPVAEIVLDATIRHCKSAKQGARPKASYQAVKFALVEMAADIAVARAFLEKLVVEHMENKQLVAETSMAKFWITDMAKRVVDRCLDLWGESAMSGKCLVTRAFRDVRVMSIFAGTNEIMKVVAAKFMGF